MWWTLEAKASNVVVNTYRIYFCYYVVLNVFILLLTLFYEETET